MDYTHEESGKHYEIILIDTPGFDDTNRTDTDTLQALATWLVANKATNIKLSGLIYLHRITDERIGHSAKRNLTMMQNLVGDTNLKNVILVSTRWELVRYPFPQLSYPYSLRLVIRWKTNPPS